jgi:hypothetical protein
MSDALAPPRVSVEDPGAKELGMFNVQLRRFWSNDCHS